MHVRYLHPETLEGVVYITNGRSDPLDEFLCTAVAYAINVSLRG